MFTTRFAQPSARKPASRPGQRARGDAAKERGVDLVGVNPARRVEEIGGVLRPGRSRLLSPLSNRFALWGLPGGLEQRSILSQVSSFHLRQLSTLRLVMHHTNELRNPPGLLSAEDDVQRGVAHCLGLVFTHSDHLATEVTSEVTTLWQWCWYRLAGRPLVRTRLARAASASVPA